MSTFFGKSIEDHGRNSGESFAFSRFLFGDISLMKGDGSHELDVVWPLAENANSRLSGEGKNFRKNIVKRFPPLKFFFVLSYLSRKSIILELFDFFFEKINLIDYFLKFSNFNLVGVKKSIDEVKHNELIILKPRR